MKRIETIEELRELCTQMYNDIFNDEKCNCTLTENEIMEVEKSLKKLKDLIVSKGKY